MARSRWFAGGAALAVAGLVAAVVPTGTASQSLRHYTVQTGDTSWSTIVRKHCDGRSTSAAATAFSLAATGSNNGTVRVGQIIHVDPVNCPATPATTATTSTTTTTTSTTVAPTTTSAPTTTVAPTTSVPAAGINWARPFAPNSPWNTPIPAGTQWFDHELLHTIPGGINGDTRRHWYAGTDSVRIWRATAADPLCTFVMPAFIDPAFGRNRPAETFQMRCPANAAAGQDSDKILFVVDTTTGDYVECWLAERSGNTITAPGGGWARGNMITGQGVGDATNNAGVRAANFSWAAGLITKADVAANKIDHAVVLSLGYGLLDNQTWRAPATAPDNGGHSGPIIMGSRLGIPAGTPRPAGLSPFGNAMFDALVKYGAFVGDFAGTAYPMLYADSGDVANDPATAAAVGRLFVWWDGFTPDMDILGPLVRVADYQP